MKRFPEKKILRIVKGFQNILRGFTIFQVASKDFERLRFEVIAEIIKEFQRLSGGCKIFQNISVRLEGFQVISIGLKIIKHFK